MSEEGGTIENHEDGQVSEDIIMPSEDKLLLADRIFTRLNPPSIGAIPSMIHKKAKTVGGILADTQSSGGLLFSKSAVRLNSNQSFWT